MAPPHVFVVLTNALPGRDEAFNAWYSGRHLADLLRIPGVRSARRMVLSGVQRDPPPHAYRYCALYEIEADALEAVIERIKTEAGTPAMPVSDALAPERLALMFEPLGAARHSAAEPSLAAMLAEASAVLDEDTEAGLDPADLQATKRVLGAILARSKAKQP